MVESVESVLAEVCYYKLLGLEPDATSEDIRRKYRERALEFHPDKRPADERERCTALFQKIQQAYECLSNEETRKWYDKNRHRITKPQRVHEDTEFDIWVFFGTCYSGFDESSPQNFFEVYRKCFTTIAKLEENELEYEPEAELEELPEFGTSQSDWKDVNAFYTCWQNFATIRSFVYDDMWQIEGRMHRRYFERKAKKEQSKFRKEYNDNVRNLANHVKSLDPRITRFKQEQEEMKLQKVLEKMKVREKLEEIKHIVKSEIMSNMNEYIDTIEQQKEQLKKGESQRVFSSNYEPDSEPLEDEFYACQPCNKIFRSKNQLDNHIRSKLHIKTLKLK